MRISHLIFLSFFFILLLFSITTLINYKQSKEVSKNTDYLTRSSNVVRESNRLLRNVLSMTSAERGYLLTGDESFLQILKSTIAENDIISNELKDLVNSQSQERLLRQINDLIITWTKEFRVVMNDSIREKFSFNEKVIQSKYRNLPLSTSDNQVFQALQKALRNFINEEYKIRTVQKAKLAGSIKSTGTLTFSLTIFSIIAGLSIAAFLAQRLSQRLLKMVEMADRIAQGDYRVHLLDPRADELGKLSTSLNHMAEVLSENFRLLNRKNEELDQFAHIVSHDLKAPLRGIGNIITWMEEDHSDELPPKVHEYLQLINGRLLRAENLIKGILSYARIGTEALEKENVVVTELVTEILENIKVPTTLTINVADNLPTLHTEKLPLFQTFSNLISNAIKHHDKVNGTVRVYHTDHGEYYQFFVEDDGAGIAPGHWPKIFKIFQTLQERDSFESTGIGLAIVKKILDARKEKIEVRSDMGMGSTFSFTWKK